MKTLIALLIMSTVSTAALAAGETKIKNSTIFNQSDVRSSTAMATGGKNSLANVAGISVKDSEVKNSTVVNQSRVRSSTAITSGNKKNKSATVGGIVLH